jgi:sulfofructose kinase
VAGPVVCVGLACVDYVLEIDAFPPRPIKMSARSRTVRGGGPAATGAVACAAMGTPAEFWGPLGHDTEGNLLRRMLEEHGVGTDALVGTDERTLVAMVLVDRDGERLIVAHGGAGLGGPPPPLPLHRLDGAGGALADCAWPQAAMDLLEAARARGVPSVLDAEEHDPTNLPRLVRSAGLPVFSEGAAQILCGGAAIRDVPTGLGEIVAGDFGVTLGARGSIWRIGGQPFEMPALRIVSVDTTGAGDVFHGVLAAAMAEAMPLRRAIRLATAAAGLKCAAGNGWDGMPTRRQVEEAAARL